MFVGGMGGSKGMVEEGRGGKHCSQEPPAIMKISRVDMLYVEKKGGKK